MKGKSPTARRQIFAAAARKARSEMGKPSSDGQPRTKKRKLSKKARAAAIKNLKKAQRARAGPRRAPRQRRETDLALDTPAVTRLKTRRGGQRRGDPHATPLPTLNSFILGSDGELPLPGFVSGTRSHSKLPRG